MPCWFRRDKLHNARAILSDYRKIGEQLFLRFNASKEDQLWYYGALVETLRQTAVKALEERGLISSGKSRAPLTIAWHIRTKTKN